MLEHFKRIVYSIDNATFGYKGKRLEIVQSTFATQSSLGVSLVELLIDDTIR